MCKSDDQWVQAGVVTIKAGEHYHRSPFTLIRVTAFMDWISQTVHSRYRPAVQPESPRPGRPATRKITVQKVTTPAPKPEPAKPLKMTNANAKDEGKYEKISDKVLTRASSKKQTQQKTKATSQKETQVDKSPKQGRRSSRQRGRKRRTHFFRHQI